MEEVSCGERLFKIARITVRSDGATRVNQVMACQQSAKLVPFAYVVIAAMSSSAPTIWHPPCIRRRCHHEVKEVDGWAGAWQQGGRGVSDLGLAAEWGVACAHHGQACLLMGPPEVVWHLL